MTATGFELSLVAGQYSCTDLVRTYADLKTLCRPFLPASTARGTSVLTGAIGLINAGVRMEAVMRKGLCIAVVGVLLIAAMIDVVAAGVKTSVVRSHFYAAASPSGVAIAVPASMKSFPAELLPQ